MYANDGFREIGRAACLRLLARAPIGRVVHTRGALPAVLPVNFVLDEEGAVVLCASAASELVRAVDGTVVAFEADAVDVARRRGWSVVVTGTATVVTDPAAHAHLVRTGPRSWTPARDKVFVRVAPELVAGRELVGGYGSDRYGCLDIGA
ncbi:pyridoxamine 5'-phosphate oxidase family protein [Streptomyces griseorubiginosus]|uniref:pyridoxamine 5'-phosphate oxidase family protein n=1 Tax=Streptomyces griseorubiginosus TaxID=67304 RepID=UPI00113FE416|nr:pyridoxamine 5'-phosphate oxidase family protein [Streptomyces griseorubiginosus]